jgi:hypothetical protein
VAWILHQGTALNSNGLIILSWCLQRAMTHTSQLSHRSMQENELLPGVRASVLEIQVTSVP